MEGENKAQIVSAYNSVFIYFFSHSSALPIRRFVGFSTTVAGTLLHKYEIRVMSST